MKHLYNLSGNYKNTIKATMCIIDKAISIDPESCGFEFFALKNARDEFERILTDMEAQEA